MRVLPSFMAAATLASGLAVASPAQAHAAPWGTLAICARGNHGHPATITVLQHGEIVKVFKLTGCRKFRAGKDLPAGNYRWRHRAPKGYLTARSVGVGGCSRDPASNTGLCYARQGKLNPRNASKTYSVRRELSVDPDRYDDFTFFSIERRD